MENFGLVSIVMPLYNYGRYLHSSVESVLKQSYPYWELLIVDDCSTDDSYDLALKLAQKDSRISVFRLEKNGGTAAARNYALDHAKGIFVSFLDSDDQYDCNYLLSQIENLKTCNADITVAGYRRKARLTTTDFMVPDEIDFNVILKGNPMSTLGTMYKFDKFSDVRFSKKMLKCEDFVFFLTLFKNGAIAKPNKRILGTVVIHDSSKSKNKFKLMLWQMRSYREVGVAWYKRPYYLFCWAIYGFNKYRNVK